MSILLLYGVPFYPMLLSTDKLVMKLILWKLHHLVFYDFKATTKKKARFDVAAFNAIIHVLSPCQFIIFWAFQYIVQRYKRGTFQNWLKYWLQLKGIPDCFFTRTSLLKSSNNLEPICNDVSTKCCWLVIFRIISVTSIIYLLYERHILQVWTSHTWS